MLTYSGTNTIDVGVLSDAGGKPLVKECYSTSVGQTAYTLIRLYEKRRATGVHKLVEQYGIDGMDAVDGFSLHADMHAHPGFSVLVHHSGAGGAPRMPSFYSFIDTPGAPNGGLLAQYCKRVHGTTFRADIASGQQLSASDKQAYERRIAQLMAEAGEFWRIMHGTVVPGV
jgi:hypothetical protein